MAGAVQNDDATNGLALHEQYWLTRFAFLRFVGLVYAIAFLILRDQSGPLIGAEGLLPAGLYLERVLSASGDRLAAFFAVPTLFWVNCSDAFLQALAYTGLGASLLVLFGFANAPLLAGLWFLYLSFVHIGQLFYGYGWEILLLETGFLAIFLAPPFDGRPFNVRVPPARAVIWLLRWVLFRVMFGAGLIKLRGDDCWRDLTCMLYHYETQPLPNPLSWYLFHLPVAVHKIEVVGNHFVELVVPWTLFAPRRIRHVGGLCLVGFQLYLIVSGNLSFLNWLTITLCIACFDDQALRHLAPARLVVRVRQLGRRSPSRARRAVVAALTALVLYLSTTPVMNLLGSRQVMNGSFDPFDLVNTYGAFGSIGRVRHEVILEGTSDATITDATRWREYAFKCQPGDVNRRPCVVAPYQYRIDWQMWFAAMEDPRANPWLIHFVSQLLESNAGALSLLADDPFPDAPPTFIRAELYEYRFTDWSESTGAWWTRRRVAAYFPPLSRNSPSVRRFLSRNGLN